MVVIREEIRRVYKVVVGRGQEIHDPRALRGQSSTARRCRARVACLPNKAVQRWPHFSSANTASLVHGGTSVALIPVMLVSHSWL